MSKIWLIKNVLQYKHRSYKIIFLLQIGLEISLFSKFKYF